MHVPCQPGLPALTSAPPSDAPRRPTDEQLVVRGLERLEPFLMSIVSDSDLWMYVSSTGGLSCGRGRAERCLFPYETDDRLHRATGLTGPYTELVVRDSGGGVARWIPFDRELTPGATRNLYKTVLGHQVVFEEVNEALGLTFRYRWANARKVGFVRTAELERHDGRGAAHVDVLDGLLEVMPSGVALTTQQRASALVNAYRHAELDPATGRLAMYRLSALIVDRAEPAEALHCNAVWSVGLPDARVLLDREGGSAAVEGRPASYLLSAALELDGGQVESWDIVADVGLSQPDVVHRRGWPTEPGIRERLVDEVSRDGASLLRRLRSADGVQSTNSATDDAHHLANVLYNCMRGGVFVDDYRAPKRDVQSFLHSRNRAVAARNRAFIDGLSDTVDCRDLVRGAREVGDADLVRLCLEYLPLTFSRRHGDPSRPWNAFDIRVHHEDGSDLIYYQGNWRDIFQNWEALAISFPEALPQMIAKFVNASTIDGFNPYRITTEGIDWEVVEPDDPWSNIGYWGDHQIVYLTRLLELIDAFSPDALRNALSERVYSYADVPYRLKPYAELVRNPRDTIEFDEESEQEVLQRVEALGADGRLLEAGGAVHHATLAEKLLVPILSKLSSFVLDGGIWMNTQRPEWNDANNALAGYGLSMVTLAQLRRHLVFCKALFETRGDSSVEIAGEVCAWADRVRGIFEARRELVDAERLGDDSRREMLDALGLSFERFRDAAYRGELGAPRAQRLGDLSALFDTVLPFLDRAIRSSRRADGLYHAYNLVHFADGVASVSHLYEMLEGQVAVLGSGLLSAEEAVDVIDALYASRMYRADQDSFMLYPDRPRPSFLAMNVVPEEDVAGNPLLESTPSVQGRALISIDDEGRYRFGAHLRNADDLAAELDALAEDPRFESLVAEQRDKALATWERVFEHHAFTGRSGTMYGYEGLGCIYWHMVSKLLVCTQENLHWARRDGAPAGTIEALTRCYQRIRGGLGSGKTPEIYGAFPTDPYSHSARAAGARQPGMTGQVKEEIITRFGELGVHVEDGGLRFDTGLLHPDDFGPDGLSFTFAGVPVVYRLGDEATLTVVDDAGARHPQAEARVEPEFAAHVFARSGFVARIEATWRPRDLPDHLHQT